VDRLGLLGILLAVVALVGGNALEGGELQQLLNLPAALIVLGGTVAAVAIQTPSADFRRALWWFRHLFAYRVPSHHQGLDLLSHWCGLVRKDGLLALEAHAEGEHDEYTRRALQLLVDGATVENLRCALEVEMVTREQQDLKAARVFEAMGGYAPTLGIVGAVMGLIHVLGNLSDPELLGAGIATAFVATIYGVAVANLLLIPLSNRIRAVIHARYQYHEMLMEGLMLIADGKTVPVLQQRLKGYLI